ncbi:hypothetical protein J1N35_025337 [Gossypium stocksii]|uniref:Uncharacterized protein n=1 Tax=Gossypium stocksii TaxID=47602 RepID=A0A9D3ZXQ0_9ROSI|nr:hypothetical protein J1N35_025337 [Gossypium stocksii]
MVGGLGLKEGQYLVACSSCCGSFDVRKVDLNALYNIIGDKLGFDVRFPFVAAWEEFASKWKNSKYFFLDEDPVEARVALAKEDHNNKAGEGGVEENETSSNPKRANDMR